MITSPFAQQLIARPCVHDVRWLTIECNTKVYVAKMMKDRFVRSADFDLCTTPRLQSGQLGNDKIRHSAARFFIRVLAKQRKWIRHTRVNPTMPFFRCRRSFDTQFV